MKSIVYILIAGFSLNISHTQVIQFGKNGTFSNNWHEGVLVFNSGIELEGLIKFENVYTKMNGMKLIGEIKFKDKKSKSKRKYNKAQIDYFTIENNSGNYEKYSFEKLSKNYTLLLRVLAEGKMNLYSEDVINTMPGFSGGIPATRMYIKMKGEDVVEYKNFTQIFKSFKIISQEYFSECPSLMTKINNGIYTSRDIIRVVEEYNACSG
jgi:hypothetical protein